eukprot:14423466-Alexandrium_andersonii.AAC.1
MHARTHARTHARMHARMRKRTHARTHARTLAGMHARKRAHASKHAIVHALARARTFWLGATVRAWTYSLSNNANNMSDHRVDAQPAVRIQPTQRRVRHKSSSCKQASTHELRDASTHGTAWHGTARRGA